jgi:hypothetical protein
MISQRTSRRLFATALAAAGIFFTGGTPSLAANPDMNVSGSICRPAGYEDETAFVFDMRIANNTSSTRNVTCPIPADIDLGGHLEWTFYMEDQSTTEATTCTGLSVNTDDTVAWITPEATTGAASFVGIKAVNSPQGPASNPKMRHYAQCTLPGSTTQLLSGIHAIRMF